MARREHSNQNGDGFLTENRKGPLHRPHPLSNRSWNEESASIGTGPRRYLCDKDLPTLWMLPLYTYRIFLPLHIVYPPFPPPPGQRTTAMADSIARHQVKLIQLKIEDFGNHPNVWIFLRSVENVARRVQSPFIREYVCNYKIWVVHKSRLLLAARDNVFNDTVVSLKITLCKFE